MTTSQSSGTVPPGAVPLHDWTPQSFSLKGQHALVIGGTSGIGKEIARGFLRAGASVVIAGRTQPKLDAAVAELGQEGSARGFVADVRDDAALTRLIDQTLTTLGHLDTLVNCQGILVPKPAEAFTAEDWSAVIDTNLRSVFFACTQVGRHMLARGAGSIISIASLSSYRGWSNGALYAMSKAGIVSLTETLATEWSARGVRVNAITPGFFLTDLTRDAMTEERKDRARSRTPVRRFGELPELVGAAVFLASPAARFVTGEAIRVDGGFLAAGI